MRCPPRLAGGVRLSVRPVAGSVEWEQRFQGCAAVPGAEQVAVDGDDVVPQSEVSGWLFRTGRWRRTAPHPLCVRVSRCRRTSVCPARDIPVGCVVLDLGHQVPAIGKCANDVCSEITRSSGDGDVGAAVAAAPRRPPRPCYRATRQRRAQVPRHPALKRAAHLFGDSSHPARQSRPRAGFRRNPGGPLGVVIWTTRHARSRHESSVTRGQLGPATPCKRGRRIGCQLRFGAVACWPVRGIRGRR